MELRGKAALVTGANGFVGTAIVHRLRAEGILVRALVRRPEQAEAMKVPGAVEPVLGDVTDAASVRAASTGTQLVVHCAASGSEDLGEAMRVNADGTSAVLEAARAAGCERLVHISTLAVYDLDGRDTVDEGTPLVTKGRAYSVSKAEADRRVLAEAARGLPVVILRPPAILGLHPTSTWSHLVPRAIAAGQFPLAGDGGGHFFHVHVRNLAEAVVLALRSDSAVGQVFNVVDGHTTWRAYAEHFSKGPLPSVPEAQGPAYQRYKGGFSGAKAVRELGYAPRYTFDEAMREAKEGLSVS